MNFYQQVTGNDHFAFRMAAVLVACLIFPAAGSEPAKAETGPTAIRIAAPAWNRLTAEDGSGLYFDLLRKIYGPAGVKLTYRIVPWKRAKEMVRRGEADAMPAAYRTPEAEGWIYPNLPMDVDRVMAVVRRGEIADWRGPDSLKGRLVVWLRGYNFQNYLEVALNWHEVDSAEQGWTMVAQGRAGAYLDILPEVNKRLKNKPDQNGIFRIEAALVINAYLRFIDRPGSRKLIEIYDRRMADLMGTPELINLYHSWGQAYPRFNPAPE